MTRLLSIDEAAKLLGVKRSTLYAWVSQRRIPYLKVGRLVRFRAEEIDKWLERNKVEEWKGV
jgi:excisionase family DNA binding protein